MLINPGQQHPPELQQVVPMDLNLTLPQVFINLPNFHECECVMAAPVPASPFHSQSPPLQRVYHLNSMILDNGWCCAISYSLFANFGIGLCFLISLPPSYIRLHLVTLGLPLRQSCISVWRLRRVFYSTLLVFRTRLGLDSRSVPSTRSVTIHACCLLLPSSSSAFISSIDARCRQNFGSCPT